MRTVPFGEVLDFIATKMLGAPSLLQTQEADAFTVYINDALRDVWERDFWPDLMRTEERYYREEWDAGTTYAEGEEVYYTDGDDETLYYRALRTTINDQPDTSTDDWEQAADLLRTITLDAERASAAAQAVSLGATRLPAVTAYTGGTSACLDGIVTNGVFVAGDWVCFSHATDGFRLFEFTAGTTATTSPVAIRPTDYAAEWQYYWKLIN